MTNYRYRIDDQDVILSSVEHEAIQEQIKLGARMIHLRGGILGINPMFVRYFKTTDSLTEPQVEERAKNLRLKAAEDEVAIDPSLLLGPSKFPISEEVPRVGMKPGGFVAFNHDSFYKRQGWKHESCGCPKAVPIEI